MSNHKEFIFSCCLGLCIMISLLLVSSSSIAAGGSIFLTNDSTCPAGGGNDPRFDPLEWVYLFGTGFSANTTITITLEGKAQSCDPGIEVLNINRTTGGTGEFCLPVYKVRWGDFGSYDLEAGGKSKIFHVNTNAYSNDTTMCCEDLDYDGICDIFDNCNSTANP
ncbi:hypothetical protein ACFLZX_05855, partial [Nanoarchaeota archaeon]